MAGSRSVNVGGKAVGTVITAGDRNKVDARIDSRLTKVTLPLASSVDISKEFAEIRTILEKIGGEHAGKIGRALDDVAEEVRKPKPDKDEIGSGLERALGYAKKGAAFADQIQKLVPHITNAAAWLGSNWHKLLPLVGLAL